MLKLKHSDQIRQLWDQYLSEHEVTQATLSDVAKWAVDGGHWEDSKSVIDRCQQDFRKCLRELKDKDGDRIYINAEIEQQVLWADRGQATYGMRAAYLREQSKRVKNDVESLKRLCAKFNLERHSGEPEFQLTFDW